ncbi:AfsR/SARP family transcriptional regulator [Streptomyces sp. GSL17-111]|uniref:AfsR/SARP family transcriptional regulator n=1 Tax=Streptomyces sp. GSL17-111 TaxID=3121596 RepID=UPI0030F38FE8
MNARATVLRRSSGGVTVIVGNAVTFHVLGPLDVYLNDRPVPLGSARQRAVLSTLLLTPGQPVTTEQLTEAVWPGKAPARTAANLHSYVSHLRRVLEPHGPPRQRHHLLRREQGGYVLAGDPESLDAVRFERLLHEGRALSTAGRHQEASRTLREALALWRGGAHPEVSDYTPGAHAAARYEELRLVALESLWEAELASESDVSVPTADLAELSARFPTHERFSLLLMKALHRSGRRAEAIDTYHRTRRTLAEDYGIDPGVELQELFGRILCGEPAVS